MKGIFVATAAFFKNAGQISLKEICGISA